MNLPFIERSDRKFLAQVADFDLRSAEISRLTRIRPTCFYVATFMFLGAFVDSCFLRGTGASLFWVIFVLEVLAYYDVQNRLRFLQLAERIRPGE
jgi:hypothetical protein